MVFSYARSRKSDIQCSFFFLNGLGLYDLNPVYHLRNIQQQLQYPRFFIKNSAFKREIAFAVCV